MADILIRGMEMPKACFKCRLLDSYFWQCEITKKTASHSADCVPSYCPLVPVPDHGRLIDADAVSDRMKELMHPSDMANNQWFINTLREMPTIIPASEEVKDNG